MFFCTDQFFPFPGIITPCIWIIPAVMWIELEGRAAEWCWIAWDPFIGCPSPNAGGGEIASNMLKRCLDSAFSQLLPDCRSASRFPTNLVKKMLLMYMKSLSTSQQSNERQCHSRDGEKKTGDIRMPGMQVNTILCPAIRLMVINVSVYAPDFVD